MKAKCQYCRKHYSENEIIWSSVHVEKTDREYPVVAAMDFPVCLECYFSLLARKRKYLYRTSND